MLVTKKNFSSQLSTRHRGPHPGIVAVVHVILFMTGIVLPGVLTNGEGFPMPFASLEKSQQALQKFSDVTRLNALL
jgi:hypothetical protein